jgi:apolipoprotein N-acyltransferase
MSGRWRPAVACAGCAVAFFALAGAVLDHQAKNAGPRKELRCLMLQPNVLQQEKWDLDRAEAQWAQLPPDQQKAVEAGINAQYEQLLTLTQSAPRFSDRHLVIWPESCLHYPFHTEFNRGFLNRAAGLGKFTLIAGCDEFNEAAFNCLITVRGRYEDAQIYRKVHLVPFGEFLPLRKQLPWLAAMLEGLLPGDFQSGGQPRPLAVEAEGIACQIIPAVCFEDTVGRVIRKSVTDSPQVIVNITNDAWFNQSSAAQQHFLNARLRCVEMRRPMLRSANTGITAAVDETGRVLTALPPFEESRLETSLPLVIEPPLTLYARFGDWFSVASGTAGLAILVFNGRRRRGGIP